MTMQANIGVAPWDCFYLGIQRTFGIQYGNISVGISAIIIIINLIMKEHIGIGTILDAMIVGKRCGPLQLFGTDSTTTICCQRHCMDACGAVDKWSGTVHIYAHVGLCCGPRDGLMVGLSRADTKGSNWHGQQLMLPCYNPVFGMVFSVGRLALAQL